MVEIERPTLAGVGAGVDQHDVGVGAHEVLQHDGALFVDDVGEQFRAAHLLGGRGEVGRRLFAVVGDEGGDAPEGRREHGEEGETGGDGHHGPGEGGLQTGATHPHSVPRNWASTPGTT